MSLQVSPDRLAPQKGKHVSRFSIGKDELNLADWPVGVSTYQQPLKADGGKMDFIETEIPRADGTVQKVTRMAPSRIGLPTPVDDDVLIALISLAKLQNFTSDTVSFVPAQIVEILRWPDRGQSFDRLEESLTRLRALTMKFEHCWYEKQRADVEPVLITGILAEAKLVRRRGRRSKDRIADSHIQWTKHFYENLREGNLTNIDLDLYFSLQRPAARQLYRHLNKRFHGRRSQQVYERDLQHLACGHLGMTKSKDLKRNFHRLVSELEQVGYLSPAEPEQRYRKVRPGVHRVRFDPPVRRTPERSGGVVERDSAEPSELKLVREFHRQWSGQQDAQPTVSELTCARRLLAKYSEDILLSLLPKVIRAMHDAHFDQAKFFGATQRFFEEVIARREKERQESQQQHEERVQQEREEAARDAMKAEQRKRLARLREDWKALSERKRREIWQVAMEAASSAFVRDRIRRKGYGDGAVREVLECFASVASSKQAKIR